MNSTKQLHKKLRKHSPRAVHKAKKLFSLKYPKLFLLVLLIILAYYIFSNPGISGIILNLENLSYIGMFISGLFFTFGFSTPFSIGFFVTSHPSNLIFAAIISGLGAMVGDIIIFRTIKFSFMNEFKELERTKMIKKIREIIYNNKHILFKHYILYVFAGIIIATPLPDEIGVSMLAGLTSIKPLKLLIISFVLHTLTILLILLASY